MKTYKVDELNNIRGASQILARALLLAKNSIMVGISTLELNNIIDEFIVGEGAEPSFKGYRGYGHASCISVNEEIVHGTPRGDKFLCEGDIVSIDIGVRYNGFCADACRTFGVGKISKDAEDLIKHTRQCFYEAISTLKAGSLVGEIGKRVESYIKENTTYSILEQYFGHGIGKNVHEEPLIPNFVPRTPQLRAMVRKKLQANSAICIEPMICLGSNAVSTKGDGWTVVTNDGKISAHYENTLIIREDGVEVLTELEGI